MSKILNILKNPNPKLRLKSTELSLLDIKSKNFSAFCADMSKTMVKKDGVGLAAPQVGKNIRLIVVNEKDGIICMINPKITKRSWRKECEEEGCLSVPNTFGQVKRNQSINCTYTSLEGKNKKINAKGLLARVIQHEIDHLDGILFIDKAKDIKIIDESQVDEN
jgi:peptide deformylase